MNSPVDVVELFASCGGVSEGLRILGLGHVGLEIDPVAASTATAAGHRRVVADVSTTSPQGYAGATGGWMSPPCTTFSITGAGAGRLVMHILAEGIARAARGERVVGWVRRECTRVLKEHACNDRKLSRLPRAERTAWARKQAVTSALVVEIPRWTHDLNLEWVACEQVPGVLPLWKALSIALRDRGYRTWCGIPCAADYGVPQTRRRAIFLASRNPAHRVGPPEPTHTETPGEADLFGDPLPKWVSMAQVLGWPEHVRVGLQRGEGMTDRYGERPDRQATEPAPTIRAGSKGSGPNLVITGYRRTRGEGMKERHGERADTPLDHPAPTITGTSRSDTWSLRNNNTANAATWSLDEPAPTMFFGGRANAVDWAQTRAAATTVQADSRVAPPGHRDRVGGERQFPEQTVRVSVAEAACLQSFRAGYPFQGTRTARYQQIGNAVPPPLAAAVVGHLLGIDWKPLVRDYLTTTVLATGRGGAA